MVGVPQNTQNAQTQTKPTRTSESKKHVTDYNTNENSYSEDNNRQRMINNAINIKFEKNRYITTKSK